MYGLWESISSGYGADRASNLAGDNRAREDPGSKARPRCGSPPALGINPDTERVPLTRDSRFDSGQLPAPTALVQRQFPAQALRVSLGAGRDLPHEIGRASCRERV